VFGAIINLPSRAVDAIEGAAVVSERYRVADAGHGEHDRRAPGRQLHTLDLELDGRLEAVPRGSDRVESLFADLLPGELPVCFHADDHAAASAVCKGAEDLVDGRRDAHIAGSGFLRSKVRRQYDTIVFTNLVHHILQ